MTGAIYQGCMPRPRAGSVVLRQHPLWLRRSAHVYDGPACVAFGNALGNSIVEASQPKTKQPYQQLAQEIDASSQQSLDAWAQQGIDEMASHVPTLSVNPETDYTPENVGSDQVIEKEFNWLTDPLPTFADLSGSNAPGKSVSGSAGTQYAKELEFSEFNKQVKHDYLKDHMLTRGFHNEKISVIRDGNTVTLRARPAIYGIKADEAAKDFMSKWDGISYEENGVIYRTDVKASVVADPKKADVFIRWSDLSDDGPEAHANRANGETFFDTSRVTSLAGC